MCDKCYKTYTRLIYQDHLLYKAMFPQSKLSEIFYKMTRDSRLITCLLKDHEYYEKYIDHRMQEHIDENEMLRWEGEQVPLHEFKKGKKKFIPKKWQRII